MRVHELKTWPPCFRAILEGRKTFEVRKNDRAFDEGDEMWLREFDPGRTSTLCRDGSYTGREIRASVTYVMRGGDFGVERGFAVLGIKVTHVPPFDEATRG